MHAYTDERATGRDLGFNFLPQDSLSCRLQGQGLEPPTFRLPAVEEVRFSRVKKDIDIKKEQQIRGTSNEWSNTCYGLWKITVSSPP